MTAASKPTRGPQSFDQSRNKLTEIAKALGCSVDDFRSGQIMNSEAAALDELLQLWRSASCPRVRQRILEFARQEIGPGVR